MGATFFEQIVCAALGLYLAGVLWFHGYGNRAIQEIDASEVPEWAKQVGVLAMAIVWPWTAFVYWVKGILA